MTRAAVLIDGMYLQHICNAFGIDKINIPSFSQSLLENDEKLFRTYVFDALPYLPKENVTPEQQERRDNKYRYLDMLKYEERVTVEEGYVKPKKWFCRECKTEFIVPIQKAVDVKLSVRLVQLAWSGNVDIIALVAGDGDFVPAVDAVSTSNAIVRLFYAEVADIGVNKRLVRACPETRILSGEDLNSCRHTD